jgi:hypothetical protein
MKHTFNKYIWYQKCTLYKKNKHTTVIPSIAKRAVPKKRGSLWLVANQGTELRDGKRKSSRYNQAWIGVISIFNTPK